MTEPVMEDLFAAVLEPPAEVPVAELDEEAMARAAMLEAGIKPPRPCECEHPAIATDIDDERTCWKCGREPR